jgi:hypothetical protein
MDGGVKDFPPGAEARMEGGGVIPLDSLPVDPDFDWGLGGSLNATAFEILGAVGGIIGLGATMTEIKISMGMHLEIHSGNLRKLSIKWVYCVSSNLYASPLKV